MSEKNSNSDGIDASNNISLPASELIKSAKNANKKFTKTNKMLIEAVYNIKNEKMSLAEAARKYKIPKKIIQKFLDDETKKGPDIFTIDEENLLQNHLVKCATLYGMTNTDIRKMIYEYAVKLPSCSYPVEWNDRKMASMPWFRCFMARHCELKKIFNKKQNTCICTTGCHVGFEGTTSLKTLEAKTLISRVYRYLKREIEYLQTCNDISLLMNILRRTAEATGVCEQTVTSILQEEGQDVNSLFDSIPPNNNGKKNGESTIYNNQSSNLTTDAESTNGLQNILTIDTSTKTISAKERVIITFSDTKSSDNRRNVNNIEESDDDLENNKLEIDERMVIDEYADCSGQYTDLQRLQQDCAPIKSVKIEIIEDESDEVEQDCADDNELCEDTVVIGPFSKKPRLRSESEEKEVSKNDDSATGTFLSEGEDDNDDDVVEIGPYPLKLKKRRVVKEENKKKEETPDSETSQCNKETEFNNKMHYEILIEKNNTGTTPASFDLNINNMPNNNLVKNRMRKNASFCHLVSRRTGLAEIANAALTVKEEQTFVRWMHRLHKHGFVITENLLINALEGISKDKNKNKNGHRQSELDLRKLVRKYPSVAKLMKLRHNPNVKTWPNYVSNYLCEKKLVDVLQNPSRLFNLEEFGLSMDSSAKHLVIRRDYTEEYRIDTERLTVVMNICGEGTIGPPMIIYQEDKTNSVVPIVPSGWGLHSTLSGWTDGITMSKYIKEYFHPWLLECDTEFPIILFMDGSKTISPSLLNFCDNNGIHLIGFPTCAKEILQPFDLGVFPPMEETWRSVLCSYKNTNNCELNRFDFAHQLNFCLDMCVTRESINYGFNKSNISGIL